MIFIYMCRRLILIYLLIGISFKSFASYILIPMDTYQSNHLKSYGIAYWILNQNQNIKWLLNYRGGAFLVPNSEQISRECQLRRVSYEVITDSKVTEILNQINSPSQNMEAVILEKAPKIAVYSPSGKQPWDDAVTLVLSYAEIPYDTVYDIEVINDGLLIYDWLHLHHEDFTGQYGKFYRSYKNSSWYINQQKEAEKLAIELGFNKVSKQKLAVAQKIKDYVLGGGFMFAMCSATDSFDIALASQEIDICEPMFDGDKTTPNYQSKLDYSKTFAFKDFILERDPNVYEFSSIDLTSVRKIAKESDYFILMDYSAKWDPIPTMLNQNHTAIVKGFMGQTTSFNPNQIKTNVLVLGENKINGEARYVHGIKGKGFFTFFGGHDPEDYTHRVGDPKTELELHPNSPGYRLILNNILFPAAKKKKQKT